MCCYELVMSNGAKFQQFGFESAYLAEVALEEFRAMIEQQNIGIDSSRVREV